MTTTRCPCLSGETYEGCCARFHDGSTEAPTAEALMRSRYSAFAVGDVEHLRRTWHESTRPRDLTLDPAVRWTRLDVLEVRDGGPFDAEGTVAFDAHFRAGADRGVQHELSRFVRDGGRWRYLGPVEPAG